MGYIDGIISLTIGIVIMANVFIVTVKSQNTSTFTATEVVLWGLITLLGIVGIIYGVMRVFGIGM